jgi:hypothetical protein
MIALGLQRYHQAAIPPRLFSSDKSLIWWHPVNCYINRAHGLGTYSQTHSSLHQLTPPPPPKPSKPQIVPTEKRRKKEKKNAAMVHQQINANSITHEKLVKLMINKFGSGYAFHVCSDLPCFALLTFNGGASEEKGVRGRES